MLQEDGWDGQILSQWLHTLVAITLVSQIYCHDLHTILTFIYLFIW